MRLRDLFHALRGDRRGNVLMIFGLALVPLTFATGMSIDYGGAMRLQTKLNAAADSAALAATSSAMMDQTAAQAELQARTVFIAQVTGSQGLVAMNYLDPNQFDVDIVETSSQTEGRVRVATVTYRGESVNSFAKILGKATLTIKGSATARAATAPNIDFFVMLDVSSSMALPTTTAGINFLKSRTVRTDYIYNPNGCAFACHQSNPDNPNVRDAQGKYMDYYTLAHLNNIELRIDAGKHAIGDMLTEAQKESAENNAKYQFSLSIFDRAVNFKNIATLTDTYDTVRTRAAAVETPAIQMHSDRYDQQTEHYGSMQKEMDLMPNPPGNGTKNVGDKPQAVMFLITDGMRDEDFWGRKIGTFDTNICTTIKSRGIRIAVLYTTYTAESINYDGWSVSNVVPLLPNIAPTLKNCATDGLFFEVSTDGSISAALNALFQKTIQTSRLTR